MSDSDDGYDIYCAWCLAHGRTAPTRAWWRHFTSPHPNPINEKDDDDGEEIERQDSHRDA